MGDLGGFNRGYTGHEHIDAFGIINMNGRVYDPLTAMFFSPDPYLQAPGDWLNYNRYGYCMNNPFRYTDPSGNVSEISRFFRDNSNTIITTAVSIGVFAGVFIATGGLGAPLAAGIYSSIASGATSATLGTAMNGGSFGDCFLAGTKGGIFGGMRGMASAGIGDIFQGAGFWNELGSAGAHSLSEGTISMLSGGDFWQGAASGALSSLGGSAAQGLGIHGLGMVGVSAALGGVGAYIGGARSTEEILYGMAVGAVVGMLNHYLHERIAKHFINRSEGYEYMYKNSIDKNGNAIREVAGWNLSDGGVVVLPFERNGKDFSEWKSLPIYKTKTGRLYLQFNGNKHFIESFIHTHLIEWNNPKNPIGISGSDLKLIQLLKQPIQIIYRNRIIYSVDGTYNHSFNTYNYNTVGSW